MRSLQRTKKNTKHKRVRKITEKRPIRKGARERRRCMVRAIKGRERRALCRSSILHPHSVFRSQRKKEREREETHPGRNNTIIANPNTNTNPTNTG